jgi:hypothetical protein
VTPKNYDRIKVMEQFMRETQAFAIALRLGVISREEWRAWWRQEYNIPLAPPIKIEPPDMADVATLPDFVQQLVDQRLYELSADVEAETEHAAGLAGFEQVDPAPAPQPDGDDGVGELSEDDLAQLAAADEGD